MLSNTKVLIRVAHLVMHELVHIDFINQARKENLNQVFISTQQNKTILLKPSFLQSII
jgi:hypothetical protein